jgi:hypothetical protein
MFQKFDATMAFQCRFWPLLRFGYFGREEVTDHLSGNADEEKRLSFHAGRFQFSQPRVFVSLA